MESLYAGIYVLFFFFSACIQQNGFLEGFYKPSTHHELPKTSLAQTSAVQCSAIGSHTFLEWSGTRLNLFGALFVRIQITS